MTALCQLYRLTNEEHFLGAAPVPPTSKNEATSIAKGSRAPEFYRASTALGKRSTILGLEEFARIDGDRSYRQRSSTIGKRLQAGRPQRSFIETRHFRDDAIEIFAPSPGGARPSKAPQRAAAIADALENSL